VPSKIVLDELIFMPLAPATIFRGEQIDFDMHRITVIYLDVFHHWNGLCTGLL
jgi:hypothetical protein